MNFEQLGHQSYKRHRRVGLKIDTYHKIWRSLTLISSTMRYGPETLFFKEYRGKSLRAELLWVTSQKIFMATLLIEERLQNLHDSLLTNFFQPPHFSNNLRIVSVETAHYCNATWSFFGNEGDNYSINAGFERITFGHYARSVYTNSSCSEINWPVHRPKEIAESLKAALPQWRKVKIDETLFGICSLWIRNYQETPSAIVWYLCWISGVGSR